LPRAKKPCGPFDTTSRVGSAKPVP
jgi:hypothetical protein